MTTRTLVVMRHAKSSWSIRHTQSATSQVQAARDTMGLTFAYSEAFQAEADALIAQGMKDKEFAKFIDAPVAGVILETGLNWLAFIVNLGALIGMTTVMLVQLYGQSRICYAMSRDGLFPKFFGEVHPKYRTPFKGTWFFGILTAIAGGFININVLFELVNIGTLSAFIIVSAGILWMRKTQPDAHRGFRAPGVPFTPICAIIFCLILIFGLNWETWVRFAVWFALGLVVYFTYSRKHSQLNEPGLF